MEKLGALSLLVSIVTIAVVWYLYSNAGGTPGAMPYWYGYAKTAPTQASTPLPSSSWTTISNRTLTMNTDGTVTLPSAGVYAVFATQENKVNSSALGIRLSLPDNTTRFIWQSVPSTGIGNSPISNSASFYAAASTKVTVVYNWSSTSSVTAGTQTSFMVVQVA